MYVMYTIDASLPDLQCLLWTFASDMKKLDIHVKPEGTNAIIILEDDCLGLHRSILSALCQLLEYCYEKEFKHSGDKINGYQTKPRPILKNTDGIKKMFNRWNKNKHIPSYEGMN